MRNDIIGKLLERGDELSLQAAKQLEENSVINASPEKVVKIVCDFFKIAADDWQRRSVEVVEAKGFCVYMLREYNRMPLKSIAPFVALDISTVSRRYVSTKKKIELDPTALINIRKCFK